MAEIWKKDFFLKYHIESIIAQKTEILVSDVSVRFSCQISRGKGYLKLMLIFCMKFVVDQVISLCFKATIIICPVLL